VPTFTATVDENGAVALPRELRERLDIRPGSEVEFFLTLDGQVHFHAITAHSGAFGSPTLSPPLSVREMDDGIADYLAEKYDRREPDEATSSRRPAAE